MLLLFMSSKKPRIVIAGQIPPPWGGQNIMVEKAVMQFARSDRCEAVHLPFFFTPEFKGARKAGVRKVIELVKVVGRLFRIRLTGPIDLLLYPTGGPQTVPIVRDILLLPWILLLSRRVILYFHAAGIADRIEKKPTAMLSRIVSRLYSKAFAAIVMNNFNRRDPEATGIRRILIIPHRIADPFDGSLIERGEEGSLKLLYVGHLCPDKGTPQLLEAFASLRRQHPEMKLDLVGECLPPFAEKDLTTLIGDLQIQPHVRCLGVLTGRAKAEAFARADLFVFPTVAPYESFGLVLAEAMAWRLPIVVSQWRGNSDVLAGAGAVCFPVSPSLVRGIGSGVEEAVRQSSQWEEWGRINRSIFQELYSENEAQDWLVEPVMSLLEEAQTAPP